MKKGLIILGIITAGLIGYFLGSGNLHSLNLQLPEHESLELVELSNTEFSQDDTRDQVQLFFALHQELIQTHQALKEQHQLLKHSKAQVQVIRSTFEGTLPLAIRGQLVQNYQDLRELYVEYAQTKNLAYRRLVEIKDLYTQEHLDEVITVYQEVLVLLHQRIALVNQANNLLQESIQLIQSIQ